MNYFKRLRDVLTFLIIWIGVPYIVYYQTDNIAWLALMIVTWVPAFLITSYLAE